MGIGLWDLLYRLFPVRPPHWRRWPDKWACEAMRRAMGQRLTGEGIEVGAQSYPFPVNSRRAQVEHADVLSPEQQETRHRITAARVVPVKHVLPPDGSLPDIADESRDFLIAAHVLEHVWDINGMVTEWKRILRPGGKLALVLPDRCRNQWDHQVEASSPEAILARPIGRDEQTLRDHLRAILQQRTGRTGDAVEAQVERSIAEHLYPHVNFWTAPEFMALVARHPVFADLGAERLWHHPEAFEFGVIFTKGQPSATTPRATWPAALPALGTLMTLALRKVTRWLRASRS